jgi:hypothetical protein
VVSEEKEKPRPLGDRRFKDGRRGEGLCSASQRLPVPLGSGLRRGELERRNGEELES